MQASAPQWPGCYGMGSIHENRIKYILAHTVPNPAKVTHSVFVEDRSKLISLVDEAWRMKGAAVPGDPGGIHSPYGASDWHCR